MGGTQYKEIIDYLRTLGASSGTVNVLGDSIEFWDDDYYGFGHCVVPEFEPPGGWQGVDFGDGRGHVPCRRHKNPDGSRGGWIEKGSYVDRTVYLHPDSRVFSGARIEEGCEVRTPMTLSRGEVMVAPQRCDHPKKYTVRAAGTGWVLEGVDEYQEFSRAEQLMYRVSYLCASGRMTEAECEELEDAASSPLP